MFINNRISQQKKTCELKKAALFPLNAVKYYSQITSLWNFFAHNIENKTWKLRYLLQSAYI
jgi:hypothetical protein